MLDTGATFSPCRLYRYRLWRIWDADIKPAMFLLLNPSTADENVNDATVERAERYARRWDYGGLLVGNIFSFRGTDPRDMKRATEPVGLDNDEAIISMVRDSGIVVCGWGNHASHQNRSADIRELLKEHGIKVHCLKVTKSGEPHHILYLNKDLLPIPFEL